MFNNNFFKGNRVLVTGHTGFKDAWLSKILSAIIKKGQRFITNVAIASMGYDLPAAIGVCIANNKPVVCVTGEGSIQMNIQELQTIVHNKLPIKVFVINNGGYHSIRQTQMNYFEGPLVGVGP